MFFRLTEDGRILPIPGMDVIAANTQSIMEKVVAMAGELENLTNEVAETRTVVESAVVLIGTLAAKIEALKHDPAALQALADDLNAQQEALAAAVSANTEPTDPPVDE